ncbi:TetR/AcrR family transcriptional regulator [Microbacterium sp. MPKO10]|uniref:TetR/AcrR family transcriptional regulator n=1 Tax=Microbacterium sp. MPKO10 TaxID=2989818 RepID=UPI002235AF92|nr:TetR/AcrR family transcriptional regulator [Microbacterium sp. MPKO10]MCW4457201.1 TetR/AcrR family transcriptional regulator [Microbacterium sp. MPKO10]
MRIGLTPERVVDTALELADASGLQNVTMTGVAQYAGVKTASLYAHVRDLNDLKTRMALSSLDELADHAAEALAGRAGKNALAALGNTYRDYARAHPGRYAATRIPLDHTSAATGGGPRNTDLTGAVLREYQLPEAERPHATRVLGATFHGFISLEQSGSFSHSSPGSDVSWQRTIDALDAMLRHWPEPSHTLNASHNENPA